MLSKAWSMGVLGLAVSSCGVERLDAGSIDDHAPASMDAGQAAREKALWLFGAPSNSFNLPCTLPASAELAGTWQGQFDSLKLTSGSSAIRIDVTGAYEGADGLCGTVTFGEGTTPPIATDPAAPPPGEPEQPPLFSVRFLEGFPYEFYEPGRQHVLRAVTDAGTDELVDAGLSTAAGAVDGNQIEFHITSRQPAKSWCNLQFSYRNTADIPGQNPFLSGPTMNCVPSNAFDEQSASNDACGVGYPIHGISCAQALYCIYQVCDCASFGANDKSPPHGCTVQMKNDLLFNLNLEGSAMSGTLSLSGAMAMSLHLTRVP
jgi:hypothetical protein